MSEILKVLIADDNKTLVSIMKSYIEQNANYKVIGIAEDEESEIKLINELRPDLVITDLKKKKGWTGLSIIEKYKNHKDEPIFFIISASTDENIDKIMELEVKFYLNKPYPIEKLLEKLEDIYNYKFSKELIKIEQSLIEKTKDSLLEKILNIIKIRIRK